MITLPSFAIEKLGPATVPSPLSRGEGGGSLFFANDDVRALYDTSSLGWLQAALAGQDEPVLMEVAGPRRLLYFQPGQVRAAIVTCGGLCPGINNVIRGLTHVLCLQYGVKEVLGIRYGYMGLVPGGPAPVRLTPELVGNIHELGGTFLGSSRGPQDVGRMAEFLRERDVQILFTIGGDGTQRGALALQEAAKQLGMKVAVVGLPKTIDNDLKYVEKTFGFETAFSLADQALKAAHAESKGAVNGVGLVKLMGRQSGSIATLASLANGDVNYVLIPEVPFELHGPKGFLAVLEKRLVARQHAVIVVAEGAGQDLLREEVERLGKDASGNQRLADIGLHLRKAIEGHCKERGIPVNVRYIDPSYMIRSAPATPNDAVFCLQLAQNAVHAAMTGRTAMLVGIWKNTFTHVPLQAVCSGRAHIDPTGPLWSSWLQATEQPMRMVND